MWTLERRRHERESHTQTSANHLWYYLINKSNWKYLFFSFTSFDGISHTQFKPYSLTVTIILPVVFQYSIWHYLIFVRAVMLFPCACSECVWSYYRLSKRKKERHIAVCIGTQAVYAHNIRFMETTNDDVSMYGCNKIQPAVSVCGISECFVIFRAWNWSMYCMRVCSRPCMFLYTLIGINSCMFESDESTRDINT